MSDHAKAAPTVGRCGMHCPGMFATSPTVVCALPAGHAGWHRSDEGTEWGISESGLPMDTTVVADYERGVAAGRRQAADAIRATHDTWSQLGKLPQSYLDGVADAAGIAEGAPAEPVEGVDRG